MANNLFNASVHHAPHEIEAISKAAASPVWVSQVGFGAAVTTVKQSTFASNNLYWMNYSGGVTAHTLEFIVTFKPGSVLTNQHQVFNFPGGYSGGTATPFGVPFWGGDPILGPAVLTVIADGNPVGTYNFTVVA